ASAQADGSSGIAAQQAICETYAERHGYTVAAVFEDAGASGAMLDRPGLDALRAAVQRGEVDVVLVASADRLARHFADQTALTIEFDQAGVSVEVAREEATGGTKMSHLTTIDAVLAEYERDRLVRRLAEGREVARARRLATQAADGATVRRVFELYTAGEGS